MADDFDSGLSWWGTARTSNSSSAATSLSFDSSAAIAAASCSSSITDAGSIDPSSLQVPPFSMDWNQTLLRSSTTTSTSNTASFHSMLQESLGNYPSIEPTQFLVDHHHHQHQHQHQHHQDPVQPPGLSMMLQGLLEPEGKSAQQPIFDYQTHAQGLIMGSTGFYPAKQQQQLQFADSSTAYWNASASAGEPRAGFYQSSMHAQFGSSYDQKPSAATNLATTKSSSDTGAQKRSGSGGSSSSGEPALKKGRIETPSPLPTFKVRKEKLGDRITALQQLVSPFGKTDTASVLHEAIEYIKFLHEQVSMLSTPYLKNGHPMQHQQSLEKLKDGEGGPKQDLRSRGLCLVPIESTYPVASETTADFWTPTFGGTYR